MTLRQVSQLSKVVPVLKEVKELEHALNERVPSLQKKLTRLWEQMPQSGRTAANTAARAIEDASRIVSDLQMRRADITRSSMPTCCRPKFSSHVNQSGQPS